MDTAATPFVDSRAEQHRRGPRAFSAIHTYIYIRTHIYMYIRRCKATTSGVPRACSATHVCTCTYTHVYVYIYSSGSEGFFMYMYIHACMYMYIYIRHCRYIAHCNTPQHTATHCNTPQHTAAHCSTLQHTATHGSTLYIYKALSLHILCVYIQGALFLPIAHTHNTLAMFQLHRAASRCTHTHKV